MARQRQDLTGRTFGRLTVQSYSSVRKQWLCQCQCGAGTYVKAHSLTHGLSASCGCLRRDHTAAASTTHGMSYTTTYVVWQNMVKRCTNPKIKQFKDYGGRGIRVCKRWRKFENFLADMGERPAGKTLDRIDNDGDYTKANCKWSSRYEQTLNRRNTVRVEGRTLHEWAVKYGVAYTTIHSRLRRYGSVHLPTK